MIRGKYLAKIGFTLAEVLITLGIIGIVAEITIPTLMHDIQDQQFKAGWKKGFSVVAQATQKISLDNGGTVQYLFTGADQMKGLYKNYLINTQDCSASDSGCFYSYKVLNGTTSYTAQRAILYLNDGSMLIFNFNDTSCNTVSGTSGIPCCGAINVDVNGQKPPNMIGKDIFGMYITKTGVSPFGTQNDAGAYVGCQGTTGWGCSAEYLYK